MVEAIIDIPLPGPILGSLGAQKKAPRSSDAPSHFLAGPENRLVSAMAAAFFGGSAGPSK